MKKHYALGRLKTGEMNKTESKYNELLKQQLHDGIIQWFKFEGLKFRLADNTTYTPDFVVMNDKGEIELHETKGYWQDDAKVKIKVASSLYPFRFVAVRAKSKKEGGGWEFTEF
jgi:hypothetical protein